MDTKANQLTWKEIVLERSETISAIERVAYQLRQGALNPDGAIELLRELAQRMEDANGAW